MSSFGRLASQISLHSSVESQFTKMKVSLYVLVFLLRPIIKADSQWIDIRTKSLYYIERSRHATWSAALERCGTLGLERWGQKGRLVVFESRDEMSLLHPHFRNIPGKVWIGLRKTWPQGTFLWTDNRVPAFTNWARGEPNNWRNYYCVDMSANTMTWSDIHCDTGLLYICDIVKAQIPVTTTTTTTTPSPPTTEATTELATTVISESSLTSTSETSRSDAATFALGVKLEDCGQQLKEWKRFGNKCYLVRASVEDARNWLAAEQYCVSRKAHLVSVMDKTEEDFVLRELLQESEAMHSLWSGLKFTGNERASNWTDGTPVNYTMIEEQPVYGGCVSFNLLLGKWKTVQCSRKLGIICKTPYIAYQPLNLDANNCSSVSWENIQLSLLKDSASGSQLAGIVVNIVISLLVLSILVYFLAKRWPVHNTLSSWIQNKVTWRTT